MSIGNPETLATSVALIERWSGAVPGRRLEEVVSGLASADDSIIERALHRSEVLMGALGPSSMRLAADWLREGVRSIDYRPSASFLKWLDESVNRLGTSSDATALGEVIRELLGRSGMPLPPSGLGGDGITSSSDASASRRVSRGAGADPLGVSSARDELEALPFDQEAGSSIGLVGGSLDQYFDDDDSVDIDGPNQEE